MTALNISACDLIHHHDDDTIDLDVTVQVIESDVPKPRTILWATIRSDFWSNPRIHERFVTLLDGGPDADLDDIELLLIAAFVELGEDLRRYGTDHGERHYHTADAVLRLLAPDVADRMRSSINALFNTSNALADERR